MYPDYADALFLLASLAILKFQGDWSSLYRNHPRQRNCTAVGFLYVRSK